MREGGLDWVFSRVTCHDTFDLEFRFREARLVKQGAQVSFQVLLQKGTATEDCKS